MAGVVRRDVGEVLRSDDRRLGVVAHPVPYRSRVVAVCFLVGVSVAGGNAAAARCMASTATACRIAAAWSSRPAASSGMGVRSSSRALAQGGLITPVDDKGDQLRRCYRTRESSLWQACQHLREELVDAHWEPASEAG
jgi:hypothetical protein